MEWKQFTDKNGVNNSFNLGNEHEIHVHGENFEGPAHLKNQKTGERVTMTPGDALYSAAMIQFSEKYLK